MEFQQQYLSTMDISATVTVPWGGTCGRNSNSNKTYPSWMDWRIHGFVTEVSSAYQLLQVYSTLETEANLNQVLPSILLGEKSGKLLVFLGIQCHRSS